MVEEAKGVRLYFHEVVIYVLLDLDKTELTMPLPQSGFDDSLR